MLMQVNDVYVDPTRVISAWPLDNGNFMLSVDQRSWTQQFEIETNEAHGWTLESFSAAINLAFSR